MNLSHPFRITVGKIVINRYHMNPTSRKRIKICGKSCNEGLTFTCFHLRDTSLMKDDTADKLHAVMFHIKNTPCRLSYRCICLGQKIVKALSVCITLLVLYRKRPQL